MLVGLLVGPPGAGVLAGPALASGGRGGVAHDVVVLRPGLHLHIVWIIIYILWIFVCSYLRRVQGDVLQLGWFVPRAVVCNKDNYRFTIYVLLTIRFT